MSWQTIHSDGERELRVHAQQSGDQPYPVQIIRDGVGWDEHAVAADGKPDARPLVLTVTRSGPAHAVEVFAQLCWQLADARKVRWRDGSDHLDYTVQGIRSITVTRMAPGYVAARVEYLGYWSAASNVTEPEGVL